MANANISIIQLIKSGEISTSYEIANLKSGRELSVSVRTFLGKTDYYNPLQEEIKKYEAELEKASDLGERLHISENINNSKKVLEDYISNTLSFAETLANMNPRSEKFQKALAFFEMGKIKEADEVLSEDELRNDQHDLMLFIEAQKRKLDDLNTFDQN